MSEPTMIDITPTPEGCRQMKIVLQQGVETYEQQLKVIADYLQEQDDPFRKQDEQFLYDHIMGSVEDLKAQIEESLVRIKEGIAELVRCGY